MLYKADSFGDHQYSYQMIPTGEVEIYDHGKLAAKVDNYQEAREWIDEAYEEYAKSSENNNENNTEA